MIRVQSAFANKIGLSEKEREKEEANRMTECDLINFVAFFRLNHLFGKIMTSFIVNEDLTAQ